MATHDAIVEAFNNYLAESENFENNNVKASAARARKALMEITKAAKIRRVEIQDRKNNLQEANMLNYIKDRLKERTSWDGIVLIGGSLLIIVAAPIVKLLAWPALAYGIWTLVKSED